MGSPHWCVLTPHIRSTPAGLVCHTQELPQPPTASFIGLGKASPKCWGCGERSLPAQWSTEGCRECSVLQLHDPRVGPSTSSFGCTPSQELQESGDSGHSPLDCHLSSEPSPKEGRDSGCGLRHPQSKHFGKQEHPGSSQGRVSPATHSAFPIPVCCGTALLQHPHPPPATTRSLAHPEGGWAAAGPGTSRWLPAPGRGKPLWGSRSTSSTNAWLSRIPVSAPLVTELLCPQPPAPLLPPCDSGTRGGSSRRDTKGLHSREGTERALGTANPETGWVQYGMEAARTGFSQATAAASHAPALPAMSPGPPHPAGITQPAWAQRAGVPARTRGWSSGLSLAQDTPEDHRARGSCG